MYFLMTNDVEHHSIPLNREDQSIPDQIFNEGLPRLLDVLSKYDISSTFYFTGMFAEQNPESMELVKDHGHEIGCHGYDHSPTRAFDILSLDEQILELEKAKSAIEPVAGKITSFRAPALRINNDTVLALEKTGFTTDSSVASQRFDGPMTFGSKKKLKWLTAPRKPYYMSYESPMHPGDSRLLEIPISAAILPLIGTTMRISPTITKILRKFLFYESSKTDKPVVFLFHPNECLDVNGEIEVTRRASGTLEYIFADVLRHKLKLRNLGDPSIKLLDEVLRSAKEYGFEFINAKEYEKNIDKMQQMTHCQ
ncbi:polysaccharide deacetylase family protein [Methanococcoides sp. NM1]|uniref:polysaccharide deacetylase family protein n=1 Tax=Methanococcoides sp. NM1 TaxID=1201013 RepID=UPI0010845B9D|nr:polysaccharide deacetylase family protein [Methanococcoides sp. NM1]